MDLGRSSRIEEIPENLVLEIIGSRSQLLFVEGEKGSYDYEIYQYVFPKFYNNSSWELLKK